MIARRAQDFHGGHGVITRSAQDLHGVYGVNTRRAIGLHRVHGELLGGHGDKPFELLTEHFQKRQPHDFQIMGQGWIG